MQQLLEAQDRDTRRETEDGGDMKMLWREAIYMAGTVGTG
jgi:hypothetical protein